MTFSFRRSPAALVAFALTAGTMAAQAQTGGDGYTPVYVVPEPGIVVSGGAPAPAPAAVYPEPVYAAPVYTAPVVAYAEPTRYYIDPVATVLTAVGVGLLFGIGGHHGGPGPGPRRW